MRDFFYYQGIRKSTSLTVYNAEAEDQAKPEIAEGLDNPLNQYHSLNRLY